MYIPIARNTLAALFGTAAVTIVAVRDNNSSKKPEQTSLPINNRPATNLHRQERLYLAVQLLNQY